MQYESPFPLPAEPMRLVGIIATHWEWVDMVLQRALAEVMEHRYERVQLMTDNMPIKAKLDLLMAYARPLKSEDPSLWAEFTLMHEALKKAYGLRNTYVHARWKIDSGTLVLTSANIKGGKFVISETPASEAEMGAAAQSIFDAGEMLVRFCQKFDLLKP